MLVHDNISQDVMNQLKIYKNQRAGARFPQISYQTGHKSGRDEAEMTVFIPVFLYFEYDEGTFTLSHH